MFYRVAIINSDGQQSWVAIFRLQVQMKDNTKKKKKKKKNRKKYCSSQEIARLP